MELLDGIKVREDVFLNIKNEINKLDRKLGLVVIQIGGGESNEIYIRQKEKMAKKLGVKFSCIKFSDDVNEDEVISVIDELNLDNSVDGILVQLPISLRLDKKTILNRIDPLKDVDGLSDINKNRLDNNEECLVSCTAMGVLEIIDYYNLDLDDKNIVLIGRSELVGKPIGKLLKNRGIKFSVCHSKTLDLDRYTKEADVLIVAVGKPNFIVGDMVKDGAIVIDVGINRVDNKICGDVDFLSVSNKVSYITPVPGGVGPVTVIMLYKNLLRAYNLKKCKDSE